MSTHYITYQYISTRTNTYNTFSPHTSPSADLRHRYRPSSYQVARGLHRNSRRKNGTKGKEVNSPRRVPKLISLQRNVKRNRTEIDASPKKQILSPRQKEKEKIRLIKFIKLILLCFAPSPHPPCCWEVSKKKRKKREKKHWETFSFFSFFADFFSFFVILPTPCWLAPLVDRVVSPPLLVGWSISTSHLLGWAVSPLPYGWVVSFRLFGWDVSLLLVCWKEKKKEKKRKKEKIKMEKQKYGEQTEKQGRKYGKTKETKTEKYSYY